MAKVGLDKDFEKVFSRYMGATKHFSQTFRRPAEATSLHPNLAGFVKVGEILRSDNWQARIRKFPNYMLAN